MAYSLVRLSALSGKDPAYTVVGTDLVYTTLGTGAGSLSSIKLTVDELFAYQSTELGWTSAGDFLYPDTLTQKVGIGTTAPNAHLHVNLVDNGPQIYLSRDDSSIGSGDTLGGIYWAGTENSGANWGLGAAIQGVTSQAWTEGSAEGANLEFYTTTNSTATLGSPKMILLDSGNVGIGTTSPAAKLYIDGGQSTDSTTRALLQQYATLTLKPHPSNSINMNFGQVNNGSGMGIQVTNGNAQADYDIALNPFGGQVGIGTTAPAEALTVAGSISASGSVYSSDVINVKAYGAVGDGTTDDSSAIQAAIDAAEALGGGTVWFPAGTYIVGTRLVINTTNVAIVGAGRHQSILKASGTLTSLLHIGMTDGSRTAMQAEVSNIQLHGSSTCTDAVLKLWCPYQCVIQHVYITDGAASGLESDTNTSTINTLAWSNRYLDIQSRSNGGKGFYFKGEKDTQFDNLHADNNTGDGFYFGAVSLNSGALFETTTCTIGSCLSRNNTGNGFVMDGLEKYVIGELESTINGGYGLKFLTSDTNDTSIALNSFQCSSFISRNDSLGGLRMADNSQVMSSHFGSVVVRGPTMNTNAVGIMLAGVDALSISSIYVVGVPGTALYLDNGTPLGGSSAPCTNMNFGMVYLNSNGHASATTNHGLTVLGTSEVNIGTLISNNLYTTGSDYEINASSTGDVRFSGGVTLASSSGDNAINGPKVNFGGALSLEGSTPAMYLRDGGTTTPPVSGHAALYIDTADGDLKIKFGDGTVKTITTDS